MCLLFCASFHCSVCDFFSIQFEEYSNCEESILCFSLDEYNFKCDTKEMYFQIYKILLIAIFSSVSVYCNCSLSGYPSCHDIGPAGIRFEQYCEYNFVV